MKSTLALLALTLTAGAALADEAPAAPADPLSFNVSVTSDYRYRGISQTRLKPALQGGADYAFDSGFYVGTWLSTIKWIKDAGGSGGVEWDIYGGYKTEVAKGLTLDVGVLQYAYPSNDLNPSANTFEVYGALSFGPVTAKYSHSLTNLFGFADSKNSGYLDVSAALDVGGGFTLTPHVGHQTVKHNSPFSYTDYSLTLNKDFAGFTFGAAVVGTDANKAYVGPGNKDLGKTSLVVSVKKTF
ncbi:TorF family putative porin [Pelomonas sp. KK5]|uniref:TorF family putative porin n=1 Tax=Pelomonas sp. KK5 TaxID=1855730 RepID=UPI00097C2F13|nr:TorF family putative porin [Pelomonas sp. KK5]